MDAVKFLKARGRMCRSFIGSCDGCPLANGDSLACENVDADTQVKAVEKWSKEHPAKTRMSEFLKQYPNVNLTSEGVPNILPCDLDLRAEKTENCSKLPCVECYVKYWTEEID